MPEIVVHIELIVFALYAAVVAVEFFIVRHHAMALCEGAMLIAIAIFLRETVGFPGFRTTFGDGSIFFTAVLVFVGTPLGMAANYFFYLHGKFSWVSFVRPMLLTPMLLLPMLGSFASVSHLDWLQMGTFALLAFQNGFFWKAIFDGISRRMDSVPKKKPRRPKEKPPRRQIQKSDANHEAA